MISAFGIDHGEISKADSDRYGKHGAPTTGRRLAGHFFPGWHGAVAGKKGKKLRSTGTEVGGAVGGSIVGGAAGHALTRGGGGKVGAAVRSGVGLGTAIGGSQLAVNRLQRKGYYKKQPKGAF